MSLEEDVRVIKELLAGKFPPDPANPGVVITLAALLLDMEEMKNDVKTMKEAPGKLALSGWKGVAAILATGLLSSLLSASLAKADAKPIVVSPSPSPIAQRKETP